jgi:hypothetical protein
MNTSPSFGFYKDIGSRDGDNMAEEKVWPQSQGNMVLSLNLATIFGMVNSLFQNVSLPIKWGYYVPHRQL